MLRLLRSVLSSLRSSTTEKPVDEPELRIDDDLSVWRLTPASDDIPCTVEVQYKGSSVMDFEIREEGVVALLFDMGELPEGARFNMTELSRRVMEKVEQLPTDHLPK